MPEPSIKIKRIWEDTDFFELNFDFYGFSGTANIDIYTTNEDLEDLKKGIIKFSTFKLNEFQWVSGEDIDNVTHFLSMRFFLHDKRGIVGIEVVADNKQSKPYWMRSNLFILTELSQIDDFIKKIEQLISEEITELESIIPV
ncbi:MULTISPECIES: hypothetical protein [unclassified Bacillus (in: firmicutes)]|uniref:hypothetical protein n=1 Tax=unclassified Bacillus (in: firmicutes) TaxID=185979 RepID=UPI0004697CE0|nr:MULTISPECIES: hypothetical protein [unclassified Bacillus (in: firmicutes)]KMN42191.1 hypothetical protein VK90_25475 [Bacillus sp. LK2]